ncbi:MAG: hypothetical protein ACP5U0_09550, partial [Caldisphaera sp.]
MSIKTFELEFSYKEAFVKIRSKKQLSFLGIPLAPQAYKPEPEKTQYEYVIKFNVFKAVFKTPLTNINKNIGVNLPLLGNLVLIKPATMEKQINAFFKKEPIIEKSTIISNIPLLALQALNYKPVNIHFGLEPQVLAKGISDEISLPKSISLASQLKKASINFREPQHIASKTISNEIPITLSGAIKFGAVTLEESESDQELREAYELDDIYESEFLGGFTKIFPDRPLIMVAKKNKDFEYIEFLKRVLREIYRVRVGGLPEPRHVSDKEDLIRPNPFEIGAGGRVFVIELSG